MDDRLCSTWASPAADITDVRPQGGGWCPPLWLLLRPLRRDHPRSVAHLPVHVEVLASISTFRGARVTRTADPWPCPPHLSTYEDAFILVEAWTSSPAKELACHRLLRPAPGATSEGVLGMRGRMSRAFIVLLLACATAISAVPPAAAHDLDSDRFRVTLRPVDEHYNDVGKKGASVGDSFTFGDKAFHRGERVGRVDGMCDVTRAGAGKFAFQCVVTLTVKGRGQITVQGLFAFRRGGPDMNETVLAITGGTGIYAGASGKATLMDEPREPTRLQINLR